MRKLPLNNPDYQNHLQGFSWRLVQQNKSESTRYQLPNMANEFLWFLEQQGIYELDKVNQETIDQYFAYLKSRPNQRKGGGLSNAHINKHKDAVLRLMEYHYQVGKGGTGFRVKMNRANPKPINVLTRDEITQLFDAVGHNLMGVADKAIIAMLYGCGLRKKELIDLSIDDIDLNKGFVRVGNKNGYEREVPMSPKVQEYVEEYLFNARIALLPPDSTEQAFLITQTGKKMSKGNLPKRVERMAKLAGLEHRKITCHVFRHSIATHLLDSLSLEEVARFLGHRSLDSTQIYTHLNQQQQLNEEQQ